MSKRDLFSELTTALMDAKAHSQGKLTLGTHSVNDINALAISPDEIVNIEKHLICRAVYLQTFYILQQERLKTGNKVAVHRMGKR
ncbi:hypothetical protein P4S65_17985 [Pseudoalteromonas sp. B131b]